MQRLHAAKGSRARAVSGVPRAGRIIKPYQLLSRTFVCIAFKWDVLRLYQLKQTVFTRLSYPTRVDAWRPHGPGKKPATRGTRLGSERAVCGGVQC